MLSMKLQLVQSAACHLGPLLKLFLFYSSKTVDDVVAHDSSMHRYIDKRRRERALKR